MSRLPAPSHSPQRGEQRNVLFLAAVKVEMLLLAAVYAYSFFFNAAQGSPRPLVFLALACLLGAATTALLTQAGKMHFQQTITAANLINVGHSLLKLGYLTLIAPNHDLLMLTLGSDFLWLTLTPVITYSVQIGRFARRLVWAQAIGLTVLSAVFLLRHPGGTPQEYAAEAYGLTHLTMVNWAVLLIAWVFSRSIRRLQRARQENVTLVQLVNHDELTGLLNRRGLEGHLEEELRQALETDEFVSVTFFDLDAFKAINDAFGHQVGDQLLHMVGQRLRELVEGWGTVGRLSGDEFVIVARHADREKIKRESRRVHGALHQPFVLQGQPIALTFSMGVSVFPQDGQTGRELLRHADTAMFSIKHNGKNAVGFYDPSVHGLTEQQHLIDREMLGLTGRHELSLVFQPIYGLQTHELHSNEALVRWNHPLLGTVSPGFFIPLAEANGQIVPIGNWVMQEALAAAAQWRAVGLTRVNVSVNVSPLQLIQPGFVEFIQRELTRQGLPGDALVVELTESRAIYDREQSLAIMRRLRALGVRLALDDFGEGFASLSQLRDLPLDAIKLDRNFADGLRSDNPQTVRYARGLIKASVSLAEHLGVMLVAEGVEDAGQEEILRELGCLRAQGYHYMRPKPLPELLEEVRRRDLKVAD